MTRPDVAALAAALHAHGDCPLCNDEAPRIIAALAAQGWRMYRNPTVSEMSEGMEDYDDEPEVPSGGPD